MNHSKDQFVPPSTPNWTGRSHRSLEDAYGRRVALAIRHLPCPTPRPVLLVIGVAVMAVLAGVLL